MQLINRRARVEVNGAVEVAGRVDGPGGREDGDAVAAVFAGPSGALCPGETAGGVQLEDEGVFLSGAGQIVGSRAGVEVGDAVEPAGNVDAAGAVQGDVAGEVPAGAAESVGPDEIARRGQFSGKEPSVSGAVEVVRSSARIEVDHALETAGKIYRSVGGDGDVGAVFIVGPAHPLGPCKGAVSVQL